jgi:hypothetical protein
MASQKGITTLPSPPPEEFKKFQEIETNPVIVSK